MLVGCGGMVVSAVLPLCGPAGITIGPAAFPFRIVVLEVPYGHNEQEVYFNQTLMYSWIHIVMIVTYHHGLEAHCDMSSQRYWAS